MNKQAYTGIVYIVSWKFQLPVRFSAGSWTSLSPCFAPLLLAIEMPWPGLCFTVHFLACEVHFSRLLGVGQRYSCRCTSGGQILLRFQV